MILTKEKDSWASCFVITSGSLVGSKWKISEHACLENGHCDFSALEGHGNPLLTTAAIISAVPNLSLNIKTQPGFEQTMRNLIKGPNRLSGAASMGCPHGKGL